MDKVERSFHVTDDLSITPNEDMSTFTIIYSQGEDDVWSIKVLKVHEDDRNFATGFMSFCAEADTLSDEEVLEGFKELLLNGETEQDDGVSDVQAVEQPAIGQNPYIGTYIRRITF